MAKLASFELGKWVEGYGNRATHVLAGSATPGLSVSDLIALSTDAATTAKALNFEDLKLGLGPLRGTLAMRETVSKLYDHRESWITPDHVITATGTTGANQTVLQGLLRSGDHIICTDPTYAQLSKYPLALGCEISPWKLRVDRDWAVDVDLLKSLIKPNTTMIVINDPSNPTGTHIDEATRNRILDIAQEHGLTVLVDEIFRPLFHTGNPPPSFVEHDYDKVVVTGSTSKAWGLSGLRIGWIVSRSEEILDLVANSRNYTLQATGTIDERIATEALSERCRTAILQKHLEYARTNLETWQRFIDKNSDFCSWTKPTAGAIGFLRFWRAPGEPFDDVELCHSLLEKKKVLLTPGSLTFGEKGDDSFKGYVRCHFTAPPAVVSEGLALIDEYLGELRENNASLNAGKPHL